MWMDLYIYVEIGSEYMCAYDIVYVYICGYNMDLYMYVDIIL